MKKQEIYKYITLSSTVIVYKDGGVPNPHKDLKITYSEFMELFEPLCNFNCIEKSTDNEQET